MPAETSNLFLLEDLEDSGRGAKLPDADRVALRTVADWITAFVARPHAEVGRAGPVCPFVPGALERRTLWLAPERIANHSMSDVVALLEAYRDLLLRTEPLAGEDRTHAAIVVVFTDLPADRAKETADHLDMQELKWRSYVDEGVVSGGFHPGNDGSAIRNPRFQPFRSPLPFFLMRHGVIGDWMFFLEAPDLLGSWARRFGDSAVDALAEELRRTEWRRLGSPAASTARE